MLFLAQITCLICTSFLLLQTINAHPDDDPELNMNTVSDTSAIQEKSYF